MPSILYSRNIEMGVLVTSNIDYFCVANKPPLSLINCFSLQMQLIDNFFAITVKFFYCQKTSEDSKSVL